MSLTAELTKSDKGLYHAQINPAPGEDSMAPEQWFKAADMLGEELGLADQRRVIVLHTKKDRTHAHVVWERYDHEKKKMVTDSFSRLAQDRARQAMEQVFEMKKTPVRNLRRPEMKEALTELWQHCKTGAEFIKEAKALGYTMAAGVQRRPFMVVDETGRSFDLVRQLTGIKTKEVRDLLKGEKLPLEKQAIDEKRKVLANDNSKTKQLVHAFADNKNELLEVIEKPKPQKEILANLFKESSDDILQAQSKPKAYKDLMAEMFADNREELLAAEKRALELRILKIRKTKDHNRDR